jgi:VanZ family protein
VTAAVALTLLAFAGLLAPAPGTGPLLPAVWHLLAGAGLGVAYAAALEPRRPAVVLGGALLLAVGALGAGELLQPLVGRRAELPDLLADAAGAALALAAYRAGHRVLRWERRR